MKQSNATKKRSPTGQRQTCWLLTCVVEDMNSGQPWTNPASGQGGLELGAYGLPVKRSNCSAALPSRLRPVYFSLSLWISHKAREVRISLFGGLQCLDTPQLRATDGDLYSQPNITLYLIKDSFSNNKKYYFFCYFTLCDVDFRGNRKS